MNWDEARVGDCIRVNGKVVCLDTQDKVDAYIATRVVEAMSPTARRNRFMTVGDLTEQALKALKDKVQFTNFMVHDNSLDQ